MHVTWSVFLVFLFMSFTKSAANRAASSGNIEWLIGAVFAPVKVSLSVPLKVSF
jgi:hypothetical protein